MANNSALVWISSSYSYYMNIYCMSNSSSSSTGTRTPHNYGLSATSCGVGCYRMYSTSSYLSSSYRGIYTCWIKDSKGDYLAINFGIYQYGFNCKYAELHFNLKPEYSVMSGPLYSCSDGYITEEDSLLQSVHPDVHIHYFSAYKCCVDKGWNYPYNGWGSLPAFTSDD